MKCNQVVLVGRLVDNVKYTPNPEDPKKDRAWFKLAVNRKRQKDAVDWISILCWGKQAKAMADHTSKGKEVLVVGEIHTRSVEKGEGDNKTYDNYTDVHAEFVSFGADSKKQATPATNAAPTGGLSPEAMAVIVAAATQAVVAQQAPLKEEASPPPAAEASADNDNPFST